MSTQLFKHLGFLELSNAGAPLSGGRVYPQRNDTSAPANTYLDSAGSTLNTFEDDLDALGPYIELDSNGRYPQNVFLTDTDTYPAGYKFIVRDANKVIQYTLDDVPAADVEFTGGEFAAELIPWIQVNSSPLNLTAADVGKAYELDTTSVSITVNLPTAASAGNGKGFIFKKKSANNTAVLTRAGSDTIDGVTAVTMFGNNTVNKLSSNGAAWNRAEHYDSNSASIDRKSGASGGALLLAAGASGHTLAGDVQIDVNANLLRVFEQGGTLRGMSADLTTMGASVGSALFHAGMVATQAQMEAGASTAVPVTPARQHFHPSAAKAWAILNVPGGVPQIDASYNVASVTDGGVGVAIVTYTTVFSSTNYAPLCVSYRNTTGICHIANYTANNATMHSRDAGNSLGDPFGYAFAAFGDQ